VVEISEKPIIRALTYFTGRIRDINDLESTLFRAREVLSIVERALNEFGFKVFTKRVSFPGLSRSLITRLLDLAESDLLVSIGYSREIDDREIVEFTTSGLYVPLLHIGEPSIDRARYYSQIIHKVSSANPIGATRLSIGFHDKSFQTPYFPDSSSRGMEELGVAFLYPKQVVNELERGKTLFDAFAPVFSELKNAVEAVESTSRLHTLVDYSLSPWMENSVAELYEKSGYGILGPGGLYFTWLLNRIISELSVGVNRTGFNEVMLPYAEDSLLVNYGYKGLLRARDLLALSSTCVAGVDMIVVPEDIDALTKLIASAMSIAIVKQRPISLRAIPVPMKPGDSADLGRFGKIPVIPY